jgi:hypothetical protein
MSFWGELQAPEEELALPLERISRKFLEKFPNSVLIVQGWA